MIGDERVIQMLLAAKLDEFLAGQHAVGAGGMHMRIPAKTAQRLHREFNAVFHRYALGRNLIRADDHFPLSGRNRHGGIALCALIRRNENRCV